MATKEAVYELSEYKAAPNGASGEFTALVSVFGNVDLVGDRVMPEAFDKSLERWNAKGNPIPVIWSHDAKNPFAHIGYVTSAVRTPRGLQVSGKNDVETNPFAKQAHQLLVDRRVTNWSFRYDVLREKRARDGANELLELDLTEVGPTLKGANPETMTIAAKALDEAAEEAASAAEAIVEEGEKAGARHSQATRAELSSIRDDVAALAGRIESLLGDEDTEKAADAPEREAEEIEATTKTDDDQEPQARSDAETLELRSLIEEMSATPKETSGSNSP